MAKLIWGIDPLAVSRMGRTAKKPPFTKKELARIAKEKENCLKQIAMFESKLANESFVARAPEKVVNDQRDKLAKAKALLEQLEGSEKRLKK